MADVVDGLFLFWVLLCSAVITLGTTFEQQIKKFLFKPNQQGSAKEKPENVLGGYWPEQQRQNLPHQIYEGQNNSSSNNYGAASNHNSIYNDYQPQQQHQNSRWLQQQHGKAANYDNQSMPFDTILSSYSESASNRHLQSSLAQQTSAEQVLGSSPHSGEHYNQQQESLVNQQVQHQLGSIPTASGFNNDCVDWVNSILFLFYSQPDKYVPMISESVYRSLNEKLSSLVSSTMSSNGQPELMLEFMSIDKQLSSRPQLTNIRTESESEKSVSATCKIYNHSLVFELVTRRLGGSSSSTGGAGLEDDVAVYELSLEQLEGKLKSVAVLSDKLIVVQFMEKPSTKILLRRKHQRSALPVLAPPLSEDLLVSLILQALSQVVVDLYFGDDPDFPQYHNSNSSSSYKQRLSQLKDSASEIKRHIKQDFFGTLAHNSSSSIEKERKIFVKILRAKNINYNQNVTCLLELDSPYQQALSSTKQGSSNPYWDEHFLFTVNEKSSELLLELWDSISQSPEIMQSSASHLPKRKFFGTQQQTSSTKKWSKSELTASGKFLGQARVNVGELRENPVQKVSLVLESSIGSSPAADARQAPYNLGDLNNSVGGEIQVEFLFLEHSVGATLQKSGSMGSLCCQQGDIVSVDRKLTPTGYVITTTTITKPTTMRKSAPQKSQPQQQQQQRLSRYDQQLSVRNQSPTSHTTSEHSELECDIDGMSSQLSDMITSNTEFGNQQQQQLDAANADKASSTGGGSRSRSRSRSFLRAIKKRFSFSRTRSRSVGESSRRNESRSALGHNLDTASIDSRSRASSVASAIDGRAKSVPASRDPNEVPTIVINRGRLSDTASAFTFTHPKSQLVIECPEPRMGPDGNTQKSRPHYKYYAISDKAANKAKWRKRGTKLHLFNEHQFVASHLAGSSTCHLCGKVFSRRPGKQGYKCRNCHLLSHKQCHIKVDHNCPYATVDGLKLEFIDQEPPAALIDRASSSNQQQRTNRPMTTKSISMDIDDR